MTVWRLEKKVGTGENIWYSESVIKRIYKIASLYVCSNCETDSKCKEKGIRCGAKMIVDIIDKESEGKMEKYELQVGETKYTIPKENLKLLAMQKAIDLKRFVDIKSDADAKDFLSRIGIVVRDYEEVNINNNDDLDMSGCNVNDDYDDDEISFSGCGNKGEF